MAILIANVPADLLGLGEALALMRSRRQIEEPLKLRERRGRLDKGRPEKPRRILCEVYAKLPGLVIRRWAILAGSWRGAGRSLAKAARAVRRRALSLAGALENPRRLARVLGGVARCLGAGCRVGKRRKGPGTARQLLALADAGKKAAIA